MCTEKEIDVMIKAAEKKAWNEALDQIKSVFLASQNEIPEQISTSKLFLLLNDYKII